MKAYLREPIQTRMHNGKQVYDITLSIIGVPAKDCADLLIKSEHLGEVDISLFK